MWDHLAVDTITFLLIDFQKKFFKILDDKHVNLVRSNVILIVKMFERLGMPMLATEHYVKGLGHTDPAVLEVWTGFPITDKIIFSCCGDPNFRESLAALGRKTVVLAGLETHICVLQTALDLLRDGYRVVVLADAVLSSSTLKWRNGLDLMKDAGAMIANTETLLFYLLGRAATPEFKYLTSLLKGEG